MKHLRYFHKGDWTFEELRFFRKGNLQGNSNCSSRIARKHLKILTRGDKRTEKQRLRQEMLQEI